MLKKKTDNKETIQKKKRLKTWQNTTLEDNINIVILL